VPGLLEAYDVPYTFADPLTASLTLHKGLTKRVLRDLGIATTDFRLVATEADLEAVDLPFPLFVKPVAEGTSKGITARSRVTDRPALGEQCRAVWRRFGQAAIVEPFLPGREVTVGIVGTGSEARALGTLEVVLLEQAEADACTYVNKERCEELLRYRLADRETAAEAEAAALAAWRGLGGRDGGRVDLRADREGRLQVMELNPLPGLHPEHSDLPILCAHAGVPYVDLIRAIVDSARRRAARAGG
jgi:D-alanine-D-alanine ligase